MKNVPVRFTLSMVLYFLTRHITVEKEIQREKELHIDQMTFIAKRIQTVTMKYKYVKW